MTMTMNMQLYRLGQEVANRCEKAVFRNGGSSSTMLALVVTPEEWDALAYWMGAFSRIAPNDMQTTEKAVTLATAKPARLVFMGYIVVAI